MSNDRYTTQCQKMIQLVDEFLPLKHWGFLLSASISERRSEVFYDSEWCRIKLMWNGWDVYTGDTISIYYGRLHAPEDKKAIAWNGKECRCWHLLDEPLLFLDGLSPIEAAERSRHGPRPDVMENFDKSALGKSLAQEQPEWLVRMHAAIWNHYEQRLFDLFDLRRPELWKHYADFVQVFYEVKGLNPAITPAQNEIC